MIPALIARMYGREDIEWNDRSWRLLENTGQIETDFWTVGGGLVGVVGAGVGRQAGVGAVRGVIGGAGLGGLVGLGAMMGKRGLMNKGQPGDW